MIKYLKDAWLCDTRIEEDDNQNWWDRIDVYYNLIETVM